MESLDIEIAWPLMQKTARDMLRSGKALSSQKQGKPYRILRVENAAIFVEREKIGGGKCECRVARKTTENALRKLKDAGGRLPRRKMVYVVARETAIVDLHPSLRWAEDGEVIVYEKTPQLPNNSLNSHAQTAVPNATASVDRQAIDLAEPPERVQATVTRIVRNTTLVREIKEQQRYECQRCGKRLKLDEGQFYAEAHHLRPLGGKHQGPDISENIIVACPNCHVLLDFGASRLDAKRLKKRRECPGPSAKYIEYHNKHVFRDDS